MPFFSSVSSFLFLPVACLPYLIASVVPSSSFFPLSPFFVFSSYCLFPFSFLLTPPVSSWLLLSSLPSVRPPVPSVARLSISLASLLASVISFFFFLFFFFLSFTLLSFFFSHISLAVCCLFLPFSCRLFLSFFPIVSFWATPVFVTCAFVSVTSFTAPVQFLVPSPPPSFSFVSISFTAPALSLVPPPFFSFFSCYLLRCSRPISGPSPSPFFFLLSSFLLLFLSFLIVIYTFYFWTSSFSFLSQGSLVVSSFCFWFCGFASGRPPSSGLLDSERSSYHIDLGCLCSLNCTRYASLTFCIFYQAFWFELLHPSLLFYSVASA